MGKPGPETRLVGRCVKAAKAKYQSRFVVVNIHGNEYGESGVSDTLSCLDGVFVAIEVKSPEASQHKRKTVEASIAHALEQGPTLKQRLFVGRVVAAGGVGGFAATVEQFMALLAEAEKRAAQLNCNYCGDHHWEP